LAGSGAIDWACPEAPTDRRLIGWALAASLLVRIAVIHLVPWRPWFDDAFYFRAAVQLSQGLGYLDDIGRITAYFPVGYPLSLSLVFRVFGASLLVAQYANALMSIATMALIHALARSYGMSARTALLSALFWGLLPNQIVSPLVTMAEIPFTFALTLGVFLLVRQPRSLWRDASAGLVFGWATLIRPQALFVPFILLVTASSLHALRTSFKPLLGRMIVVALCLAAVVAPWTYRNYQTFHTFVLVSTNGGENLLIGNNPATEQRYRAPKTFYPAELDITTMPELERDRLGSRLAKDYLRAHPLEALIRAPRKLWHMYRSDLGVTNWVWGNNQREGTPAYYLCQALTQLSYLLVLAAGAIWLVLAFRRQLPAGLRSFAIVAACLISYFSLITLIFFGDARYHQPLMPFFAIAAACCFADAAQGARRRRLGADLP
jgi:hypothetical protein